MQKISTLLTVYFGAPTTFKMKGKSCHILFFHIIEVADWYDQSTSGIIKECTGNLGQLNGDPHDKSCNATQNPYRGRRMAITDSPERQAAAGGRRVADYRRDTGNKVRVR